MTLQRRETTFFGKEHKPIAIQSQPAVVSCPDTTPPVNGFVPSHVSKPLLTPSQHDRLAISQTRSGFKRKRSKSPEATTSVICRDPWQDFSRILNIRLGGLVTLVSRKPVSRDVFTIRTLADQDIEQQLYMLMQFRHEAILEVLAIYLYRDQYFVVSFFIDLSLTEIVAFPVRASEQQIA